MTLDLADRSPSVDEELMATALLAAREAAGKGEVPIGAAIVIENQVVAVAGNAPISLNDPTAHAEVLALRDAARVVGNYRLVGSSLYVTVEPCVMCVGALLQARVSKVIYGCSEPKGGALGSVYDLGRDSRLNHRLSVTGGVCSDASRELLQSFFRQRRGA